MNPKETTEMTRIIRRMRDEGGYTILLVEHKMNLVGEISDRVVVLDYGQKIAEGSYGEVVADPQVRRAGTSVVKILGEAQSCNRDLVGSGFGYAPGRVMTNAHVVAGVSSLSIEVDGDQLDAEVVLFDPDLDVAVLAVDGLDVPALRFDGSGGSGDGGAVLGYPENGPFDAQPARIRDEQRLRSPDIYDDSSSVREVFSVRSTVRPGNSGGPLVSDAGRVYGVVFAASVTDVSTGYALTADQVSQRAATGRGADDPVSTGECA